MAACIRSIRAAFGIRMARPSRTQGILPVFANLYAVIRWIWRTSAACETVSMSGRWSSWSECGKVNHASLRDLDLGFGRFEERGIRMASSSKR